MVTPVMDPPLVSSLQMALLPWKPLPRVLPRHLLFRVLLMLPCPLSLQLLLLQLQLSLLLVL